MAGDVVSSGLFSSLSGLVGTSEPALRLLFSIFLGYPLALFHRKYLYGQKGGTQHLFFALSGITIGYFNYGIEVLHPLSAILYTYLITTLLNGTLLSLRLSFFINSAHLLLGYYCTGTDDYDIKWTMPHCVLVLRLIGYSFNIYDGTQPDENLSNENQLTAIKTRPNFLEYCGFMCFPASFLVGPQFPYKRYENLVNGNYRDSDNENDRPQCIYPGINRLLCGVFYLAIFQVGSSYFNEQYLFTEEYAALSLAYRMLYLAIWARFQFYKYISCWLITEGALIMFSLAYNGKDENKITRWNGCENIRIFLFENTREFGDYIHSFNINTNQWVGQYIYKRLKFLGNRNLSQFLALMFLAVWHGFHSGYYVCFFMEFIVMFFEKGFKSVVNKNEKLVDFFSHGPASITWEILIRTYTFIFMGWCLAPFVLLKFPRYWHVFGNVYYSGFLFFLPWAFVYRPIVKAIVGKSSRDSIKSE